jgi:hypothetical protein
MEIQESNSKQIKLFKQNFQKFMEEKLNQNVINLKKNIYYFFSE